MNDDDLFKCCRCGKMRPFLKAWSRFFDQNKPEKWWCEDCEDDENDYKDRMNVSAFNSRVQSMEKE